MKEDMERKLDALWDERMEAADKWGHLDNDRMFQLVHGRYEGASMLAMTRYSLAYTSSGRKRIHKLTLRRA